MQINNFTFQSSNRIDTIRAYEWIPDGEPCAAIQLAHGMNEYMHNYECFAEFMCKNGFYVIGMDCIGHGNTAPTGKLGYFPDRDSTEFLLLDMRKLTEIAREHCKNVKHIMYGHSFGSFLTRIYISRYRDVDGAVIMGSGDMDLRHTENLLRLIKIHRRRHNGIYRSKFIQAAAFGKKLYKFLPLKNSFDWSTRDAEKVQEYINDSKNNYVFTLNGFETLFKTLFKAQDESVIENTPKGLPILLISGREDAIGDYGKGMQRVYNDMCKAGLNAELKLYDGARHNLMQETCAYDVHEYILKWCKENL